jgi:hypothetical protein
MAAAFAPGTKLRVPYRRAWQPASASIERRIVDEWYVLCARQERGDELGARISTTTLHDLGVHLFRARKREPSLFTELSA